MTTLVQSHGGLAILESLSRWAVRMIFFADSKGFPGDAGVALVRIRPVAFDRFGTTLGFKEVRVTAIVSVALGQGVEQLVDTHLARGTTRIPFARVRTFIGRHPWAFRILRPAFASCFHLEALVAPFRFRIGAFLTARGHNDLATFWVMEQLIDTLVARMTTLVQSHGGLAILESLSRWAVRMIFFADSKGFPGDAGVALVRIRPVAFDRFGTTLGFKKVRVTAIVSVVLGQGVEQL